MIKHKDWTFGYRVVIDGNTIGVYAVILSIKDEVLGISKYPVHPRNPGEIIAFKEECKEYQKAFELPPIIGWKWSNHQCFIVNSWDENPLSDENLQLMIESYLFLGPES